MKKRLVVILCFCISYPVLSQTDHKLNETRLKLIAREMCNCISPSTDTLHKRVKEFIKDILLFGENSATASFNKWRESASAKEIASAETSLLYLKDSSGLMLLSQKCLASIKSKYPSDFNLLIDTTTDNYEKLIETILSDKKCELLGIIMRIDMTDVTSRRPGEPFINIKIDKRNYQVDNFLTIPEDSIHIKLYCTGTEDGDTVSVYLNYKIVIENLPITNKPFEKTLCISNEEENSLVIFAENLGRIPPNISMLEIKYGNKVEKIKISTNLMNNRSVIITHPLKE